MSSYFDIIIIGSGMSGLYAALKVKKLCPDLSFMVIERNELFGGRSYDYRFENTDVVTGAGIGRKNKDKLLLQLMKDFKIPIEVFETQHKYSSSIQPPCEVKSTFTYLKRMYDKENKNKVTKNHETFKQYAKNILGEDAYNHFIVCAGYSDYENEDVYDTFYHYEFDDNYNKWLGFSVPWKTLVDKIVASLGKNIINNTEVTKISNEDNYFEISTKLNNNNTKNNNTKNNNNKNIKYYCEKVVIATDIDALTSLIHNISPNPSLYYQLKGQPFLRLYAKFSKESIPYLKEKIQGVTVITGPMQKVIPMNPDKGVYMIVYSDNDDADFFKKYFKNNEKNRTVLNGLLEKSLDLNGKLHIENIKDFYWKNGTHYYAPLTSNFKTRQEFIKTAQRPDKNVLIVRELISIHQGWVEGALESVNITLTKDWLEC
jgi:L-2-hydroxyglutarate oxidase LhgO